MYFIFPEQSNPIAVFPNRNGVIHTLWQRCLKSKWLYSHVLVLTPQEVTSVGGIVGMKGAAAVLRIETNYISGCCEATASAALWPSIISSFHTSQKQRAGLICEGRGGWVRRLGVLELSLAAYTLTLLENHKELSVSQCVNQFNNTNSF